MLQKSAGLGERIRKRREDLGMSKADLARAAHCSNSAVGQWEKGDTKNLKLDNLFAVADALEVSARELALGEAEPSPELDHGERELLAKYRASSPRWQLSLRLLAGVGDEHQNEVSESVNVLMAKIFAKPVADERVAAAYGRPGEPRAAVHEPRGQYRTRKTKGESR